MQAPGIAGFLRLRIAMLSGAALEPPAGHGPDGHFLGVALGISTNGLVCAWRVRASVGQARLAGGR